MSKIYIETRKLEKGKSVSPDLARHYMLRSDDGVVLVVVENPRAYLAAFSKCWNHLIAAMRNERSGTLTTGRIQDLNLQLQKMQHLRLLLKAPEGDAIPGIYFVTVQQIVTFPLTCHTVYVAEGLSPPQLEMFQAVMPAKSLLVLYY